MKINVTSVMVDDQTKALRFYTEVLGFVKKKEVPLGEHFWLTVGYVLFFLVHILQVIKAGWANFRSMVTGYDVVAVKNTPIVSMEEGNS